MRHFKQRAVTLRQLLPIISVALGLPLSASSTTVRQCPRCCSQSSASTIVQAEHPVETVDVSVPPGLSLFALAEKLAKQNVIDFPWVFLLRTWLSGQRKRIQAGEYRFTRDMTHKQVLEALCRGHVFLHKVTLPEGVTVAVAARLLQKNPCLTGSTGPLPKEGHLLPGTYTFLSGESRQAMLKRMSAALDQALAALPLPPLLPDKESLLILASIVEKETQLADEKLLVAGVLLKRLQLKMRLQADPTVVYGLTLGQTKLPRLLTQADLKKDSPYNTYLRKGLPPTPICCPGIETLRAVSKGAPGPYLFFVADGRGGHAFSSTLSEHNKQNYRRKQAARER